MNSSSFFCPGGVAGVSPAREGGEQRSVSQGETSPSKELSCNVFKPCSFFIMSKNKWDFFEFV